VPFHYNAKLYDAAKSFFEGFSEESRFKNLHASLGFPFAFPGPCLDLLDERSTADGRHVSKLLQSTRIDAPLKTLAHVGAVLFF